MIKLLKPGKFYVVDLVNGPILGPFDNFRFAECERTAINISDDCVIGEAYEAVGKAGNRCVMLKPAKRNMSYSA